MKIDMSKEYWKYLKDPQFVEYYLMPKMKSIIGKNKNILDIGTRSGIYLLYYCYETNNRGIGIDIGDVDGAIKNKIDTEFDNVEFIGNVDATRRLPFSDKYFDVSIASAIIEHIWIPGDRYMVEEMIRVSKEKVIISTPRYEDRPNDSDRGRGCIDHINLFDEKRFNSFLGQFDYKYDIEIITEGYSTIIGIIYL